MIRVVIPYHLRTLAKVEGELNLELAGAATLGSVLDAMEAKYPMLRGTVRDQGTGKRRSFIRFFACKQDISHDPIDTPLPEAITSGQEPLLVIGAMAGG